MVFPHVEVSHVNLCVLLFYVKYCFRWLCDFYDSSFQDLQECYGVNVEFIPNREVSKLMIHFKEANKLRTVFKGFLSNLIQNEVSAGEMLIRSKLERMALLSLPSSI